MVPFCPGRLHGHAHSSQWQQHGETHVDIGTHGEAHWVPTVDVPQGKHQHPAASSLPSLKQLFPLLASSL